MYPDGRKRQKKEAHTRKPTKKKKRRTCKKNKVGKRSDKRKGQVGGRWENETDGKEREKSEKKETN